MGNEDLMKALILVADDLPIFATNVIEMDGDEMVAGDLIIKKPGEP